MDNRGDTNWGSQATTNALVQLINERFPGAHVAGVPRHQVKPSKVFRDYVDRVAPDLVADDARANFLVRYLITKRLAHVWRSSDLIIVNGEGTLHPQKQLRRWLPAICLLQRRYPKPMWVVNTSISFRGSDQEMMFDQFLRCASYIAVRDHYSYRELQQHGIACTQSADCAFLTEPSSPEPILRGLSVVAPYAVLTGSIESKSWSTEVLRNVVEHLRDKGFAVIFTSSSTQDDLLYKKLHMDIPLVTHTDANYRELMGLQAGAEVLVGGRYHPTILAALSGTPFVALPSNTTKMDALMEVLGTERFFLKADSSERILSAVDEALGEKRFFNETVKEKALAQRPLSRLNLFRA
jgi:polysaccharide pyruvyl transferase WcaK-like protein